MSRSHDDTAFALLTRHFLKQFFRLSFLDDAGEESFVRAMLGVVSAIIVFGLALARLYVVKYGMLAGSPTAEPYVQMLPADQLLMIVLPMVIVTFVVALVSHSLFPDQLDMRVLLSLPVSRRTIFLSKVTAVVLFAAIFILAANITIGVPFTLLSHGRWATPGLGRRLAAQLTAGIGASMFAVAAIVAVQGVLILALPQRWRQRALVGLQTLLVCEVVLSLPLVIRLPRVWRSLADGPAWLMGAAPGWFLGLERALLGNGTAYDRQLAGAAAIGSLLVCAIATACYLILYQSFDRLSLQGAVPPQHRERRWRLRLPWTRHPAYAAVRSFTGATLRRSGLHQLAVFGALTAGLALAFNGVLLNLGERDRWLMRAAATAPLLALLIATLGVRGAFLMPTNLRAAWLFRFTERADCRVPQLNAVRAAMLWRGVLLPMVAVAPLQYVFLGPRDTLAAFPVAFAIGWLLVDVVTLEWRRIPFTCTVLFGKRPMAQTVMLAFIVYFVFGFIGTSVVQAALVNRGSWLVVMSVLLVLAAVARWARMQTWGQYPLEFEDYLPDGLETLRL